MSVMRAPGFGTLWLGLAVAYFTASAMDHRAAALAALGLMAGTLVAASGRRIAGLVAGIALAIAAWHFAEAVRFLVFVPPLAAFAFMAHFFGRTLRAGSEPLITRIARKEQSDLPPEIVRHTRWLTTTRTECFVALFVVALGLAFLVSLEAWSRWVLGLGYAMPGALFLGEYVYRGRRFPLRHRDSLAVLVPRVVAVMREIALEPGSRAARDGEPR